MDVSNWMSMKEYILGNGIPNVLHMGSVQLKTMTSALDSGQETGVAIYASRRIKPSFLLWLVWDR